MQKKTVLQKRENSVTRSELENTQQHTALNLNLEISNTLPTPINAVCLKRYLIFHEYDPILTAQLCKGFFFWVQSGLLWETKF